jgi:hypothetical protein
VSPAPPRSALGRLTVHASSPAIRRAIFGDDGQGLITFLVNEETEKLRIIDILWLG